jgi:SAM-dependent methyltransferase
MNLLKHILILVLVAFKPIASFEVLTYFDDKKTEANLNDFTYCLQKNADHFLIDNIHVFYKNPPVNLPAIFQNPKIKVIPLTKTPYIGSLFKYANAVLNNRKIILTSYNSFFDDSLFKLNYYNFENLFLFLNNNTWFFKTPHNINYNKQVKLNDSKANLNIQEHLNSLENIKISNPALDVLVLQYRNNTIIPNQSSNIDSTTLEPFLLNWDLIKSSRKILLYDGNMHVINPPYCTPSENPSRDKFACLSHNKNNSTHLIHNINEPLPLPDNCVDVYQAEEFLEHLEYEKLPTIINEIYRVLKPGGFLRISIPDYRCDVLYNRSQKDEFGKIIFDQFGGGQYVDGKVIGGGHLWFPMIENTKALLAKTKFNKSKIKFLHYYNTNKKSVTNKINYKICYVRRTPDHDGRVQQPYRAMSLVVDLFK